jgi:hypothetical protein
MPTTRRDFLDRVALGTAALGGISLGLGSLPTRLEAAGIAVNRQGAWDTAWPNRLTGRVKTVFDVPEIESGYGVWRASIWAFQYEAALGVSPRECSTALVLRHNAIVLAMKQEYWDAYGVGKDGAIPHPVTQEPTAKNPALLGAADGLPAPMSEFNLDAFMKRGGVILACDLALQDVIGTIAKQDGIGPEAARAKALSLMVPGVVLQPSGVFAVLLAQQVKQAIYIRAS